MEVFPRKPHHRYSREYVSAIADETTRAQLANQGLPNIDDFFEAGEASEVEKVALVDGLPFLRIGCSNDPRGFYGVDCQSGAIFYVMPHAKFLVNSSPRQFEEAFSAYESVTYDESLIGDPELAAITLRSKLLAIDEVPMSDPGSYWNDVMADVAIGIYGDG